ncbi:MAG: choice-of-anchor J domain-containing protein [Flavobacteriales bacterium]|nr:choice-of-anchor J domain-containing protein [Flavobacteriales bacterium]
MNCRNTSIAPLRTRWWPFVLLGFLCLTTNVSAQFPQTFDGTFLPAGWVKFETGPDATQQWVQTATTQSGAGAAFIRYSVAGATNVDYLVSPQFTPTAGQSLTFWEREAFGTNYGSTFSVWCQRRCRPEQRTLPLRSSSRAENGS